MLGRLAFRYNRKIRSNLLYGALSRFFYMHSQAKKFIAYGRTDIFSEVIIETTSDCNRRCGYCPVTKRPRQRGLLPEATYKKIIDCLKDMGYKGDIGYHFFSEPLMDGRLGSFISLAHASLPASPIIIYTNGDLLTRSKAESLFACGASSIYVTIHSGGRTSGFLKTYRSFPSEIKRRIAIRELSPDDLLVTRGGLVEVKNREVKRFCSFPSESLTIDYKGNVVLCCEDYLSEHRLGDASKESIRDIWDKPGFRKLRKDLSRGRFSLPICRHCAGTASED